MEESTSQAESPRNQLVGQRIGSYRILDVLGSGGMSTVYRAVHVDTGHEVALKVLIGTLARSSTLLQRFLREARSAETLEHANIVTIFDRGVDKGRHYLVLEYVEGGDFHDYVQRNGPLAAPDALAVVRGIASGLRYAAGRGLIHRDIKPSNILRTPTGEPKVIDLGLALQSEFEDERVTREGTTVGTVDYMAPEQARDSRATSIQSDMYSLGCTFYYLLAGVPPYPGGDITEKLTRHARAIAPDIRDLRPDIPVAVSSLIVRLMAKQPEHRFADYDALIADIDAVGTVAREVVGTIPLAPLDEEEPPAWPTSHVAIGGVRQPSLGSPPGGADDDGPLFLESPGGLSLDLSVERDEVEPRRGATVAEAPLPRLGRVTPTEEANDAEEPEVESQLPPRTEALFPRWILATAGIAVMAVLLVVGLHFILGGPRAADLSLTVIPDPELDSDSFLTPGRSGRSPRSSPGSTPGNQGTWTKKEAPARPPEPPKPRWEEPEDTEPVTGELASIPSQDQAHRTHLPEWTRSVGAARLDDPPVVVRRVPDPADGPIEPTLTLALDGHIGGIVELADDGPLPAAFLPMPGESRVIRARKGYRPIIRIQRSRHGAALEQTSFLTLDRKSLTLEGLDIIIDASDLSGRQTALFGCVGSNLTLRDCTITVIHANSAPFTLIRQEAQSRQERAPRPSRIWLDRSLIRGSAITVSELSGGPVDLVVDCTAILLGGFGPPVVRVARPEGSEDQRIFLAGALVCCPGPVISCQRPESTGARGKPLVIRADGSAFGRLQVPGISSIITSNDARASANRQVDWSGDFNLFAGWKGIFASGTEPTITVDGLTQARSTWNAAEQGSQEYLAAWSLPLDPVRMVATEMDPLLLPDRHPLMAGPARPAVGLFRKTFDVYPDPAIPEPAAWTWPAQEMALSAGLPAGGPNGSGPRPTSPTSTGAVPTGPTAGSGFGRPTSPASRILTMRTDDSRWAGDLGAFLRDRLSPGDRHVLVRVVGSGTHGFTPVRLPDGLTLEIQVEMDPRGDSLPSWSADPRSSGPGLIELHGGALVLSHVFLRHDPVSRAESLLALEDSHLILYRCQLTVPQGSGAAASDLIAFRAPWTQPMADHPGNAVFQGTVDRPVCRLIDSILIANRTALRVVSGRGLVALTRCAVASDETAIELDPSRVVRRSFWADLWLDRCAILAARSIVGLGPWPGVPAGPDRPWLVNSRNCAFLGLAEARSRDSGLLHVDADAYAGGCLFWQADGDAFDLDHAVTAGAPAPNAPRRGELPIDRQWETFWASHHVSRTVTYPRATAIRARRRPRAGQIDPADLDLDQLLPVPRGAAGAVPGQQGGGFGGRSRLPGSRPN